MAFFSWSLLGQLEESGQRQMWMSLLVRLLLSPDFAEKHMLIVDDFARLWQSVDDPRRTFAEANQRIMALAQSTESPNLQSLLVRLLLLPDFAEKHTLIVDDFARLWQSDDDPRRTFAEANQQIMALAQSIASPNLQRELNELGLSCRPRRKDPGAAAGAFNFVANMLKQRAWGTSSALGYVVSRGSNEGHFQGSGPFALWPCWAHDLRKTV